MEIKHSVSQKECKGVGNKQCGKSFKSYNDLMDHRRDDHNSGNKVCRYFKEGNCQFKNNDKEKCWYLHQDVINTSNDTDENNAFNCKSCEKKFKSRYEVMNHRKEYHEDEVPPCKDFVEGRNCLRHRYWFIHKKNIGPGNVSDPVVENTNSLSTNVTNNNQGFWHQHQSSKPPDQMIKVMEMLTALTTEVSRLKMTFQQK